MIRIGHRRCDCPRCFNDTYGTLKIRDRGSLFGRTRLTIRLCNKHYRDLYDFLVAYMGGSK